MLWRGLIILYHYTKCACHLITTAWKTKSTNQHHAKIGRVSLWQHKTAWLVFLSYASTQTAYCESELLRPLWIDGLVVRRRPPHGTSVEESKNHCKGKNETYSQTMQFKHSVRRRTFPFVFWRFFFLFLFLLRKLPCYKKKSSSVKCTIKNPILQTLKQGQ